MPSSSLRCWKTSRTAALDELEAAHRGIGGTGRGRRYATEQVNHAYTVMLSSQFQGFCRDLHSECADLFVLGVPNRLAMAALKNALVEGRKLDRGNPTPGHIGADFGRFGIAFWTEVRAVDQRSEARQAKLQVLNTWRNAIAHQDFVTAGLAGSSLNLQQVRRWRGACDQLATSFDRVMWYHLDAVNGVSPWQE